MLAKIESADSVNHLEEILDAVDGAMVARGDLGAELPVEQARLALQRQMMLPVHIPTDATAFTLINEYNSACFQALSALSGPPLPSRVRAAEKLALVDARQARTAAWKGFLSWL